MSASNPLDLRIEGPGIEWSSDPAFPPIVDIPFESSDFLQRVRESGSEGQTWQRILDRLEFARFDRHSYVRIHDGDYQIVLVTPKLAVNPGPDLAAPLIGLISILVLAGCYAAVRWLVRPIRWIKQGADRIGQGDLDYRIPKARNDDLGELTSDINRMAEDVQAMLESKRQLLLAISHELRSPLTRTKVALEFLDDQDTKQHILEDVHEMERLIDDLLEGERLNSRHSKLQLTEVDLAGMIRGLLEADFTDARDRLRVDLPPAPLVQAVDAKRIRLLVKNLLDNALCYTPQDGPAVELSLGETGGTAVIRVKDHGPGMSPNQVERATEPFYRADPARCRDTGGFGLGLYLCRRIAEAHGGRLDIVSREGHGTEITVRLPAAEEMRVAA